MINGIIQKNSTKNVRIFPEVGDLREKKITGPERKMNMGSTHTFCFNWLPEEEIETARKFG